MITITYMLVKLIILILKAKEKIREVEYFDLELELFPFRELFFFVFDWQLLYVRSCMIFNVISYALENIYSFIINDASVFRMQKGYWRNRD